MVPISLVVGLSLTAVTGETTGTLVYGLVAAILGVIYVGFALLIQFLL